MKTTIEYVKEEASKLIAYILPARIIYFCLIRAIASSTTGRYSETIVPEVPAMEVLRRWERDTLNKRYAKKRK